ncbi:MAG TPA: polysaccharide biosynthesis tyrosine autokinase [Gammaproteobacteria bacterium]|nr:polysaccharide biosynthesis tyrosine autokinase [Gammaproteobacteria bacterium]
MTENIHIQTEPHYAPPTEAGDEVDLRELLAIVIDAKWLIAAITAAILFLAVFYALFATPIYQSNVLLQVNEDNAAFQMGALSDIAQTLGGQAPPADTEIAIMKSRFVVGRTVDKLGLTIEAEPNYLPLIGGFVARHYDGITPAAPFLWFDGHAWGGESIKVTRLNVPQEWLDKELTLIAGPNQTYTLYGPEDNKLLTGKVGQPAYYPSNASPSVSLFVSDLVARPGTNFTVSKSPRLEVINNLTDQLSASETSKGTNIVRMSLEGPHPQKLVNILDTLADTYIQQNVHNNAQQARESLKFLKQQLPKIKAKLDAAQGVLAEYQTKHQALDISADTKGLLDQMVNVQQQLAELKLKETEMSGRFNDSFPALQAVRAQIRQMQQIKGQLEDRIKDVPKNQQAIFKLERDVKVDSALYMSLLNQAQQLKITEAGTVGNARIIDHAAMPIKPIKPKKSLIAALGLALGLMLGVFVAFVRHALNHGIDDPDLIEQEFGIPVYAIIPHSDELIKQQREAERHNKAQPILSQTAPDALAVEALRSLRTSMQFALPDTANNVVAISGPSPSVGKSFVSINLSHLLADSGKRVLLIDGDMRKGHLHDYFGAERTPGLSDILAGKTSFDAAIHHNQNSTDVLFSGMLPPNPSELLMNPRFAEMIEGVAKEYDVIIIDAPPILAVTDGAIIARQAGVNFMVIRAGQHPEREIKLMLRRFEQNGTSAQGIIFNDVTRKASGYSKSKYGYQYQYEYK